MHQDTVVRFRKKDEVVDPLRQLLREGAQRLIGQAVSAKLELFLEHHEARRDAEGRRAVVRNGYLPSREVLTGIGPVKVRDRSGEEVCFRSTLVLRPQRGGGAAGAVSEGGLDRQHAGSVGCSARRAGGGVVGARDLTAEGGLEQAV